MRTFAHLRTLPELRDELNATPLFRHSTYWRDKAEPGGWLRTIDTLRNGMVADMRDLPPLGAGDLVVANSVSAGHLLGLAEWLGERPSGERPFVVVEFGHDPGVDPILWPPTTIYRMRNQEVDARAGIYRAASQKLAQVSNGKAHFVTFDPFCSSLFSAVIGLPVRTLPSLVASNGTPRKRGTAGAITVGIVGSQRLEKGYHLVPDIIRPLLAEFSNIRLLVHNSGPSWLPAEHERVQACARELDRIEMIEEPAGPALWARLLEATDLMLCPYEPQRYHGSYSAVAVEALANAIPIVGPRHSAIHRLIERFPGIGETFGSWTAESVAGAARALLQTFESYSTHAFVAAGNWSASNGPEPAVAALLRMLKGPDMCDVGQDAVPTVLTA